MTYNILDWIQINDRSFFQQTLSYVEIAWQIFNDERVWNGPNMEQLINNFAVDLDKDMDPKYFSSPS